ncbi:MAG: CDP-glycerol glycerophosphotransferase family protein [Porcipelethomonas sp.]
MTKTCLQSLESIDMLIQKNHESIRSDEIPGLIYEITCELSGSCESIDLEKTEKMIDWLIDLCKTNIRYRIRVLFVAELGGKWDAMSSVYEACKKRDDIDVDVVIEPIFRVNTLEDGTQRNDIIYEDWLTPLGISHTLFKDYEIEKMLPDITFISQPYETVTIPMFYPENIARYSRLVYLPYFNSKNLLINFDSLFRLKTQKCSWKIACQSELMRKYYQQFSSRHGENVIASGIPKLDYPFKLNKENTPMPSEWKHKIAGKKVFLWNSHFGTPKNTLNIGKNFLEFFDSNDDIAMIWRPHPMAESVIKVYNPELHKEYLDFMMLIEGSKNIVIDYNPTYDASFVWSDALLSDYSSVADQYLMMKKPVAFLSYKNAEETRQEFYTVDGLFDFTKIPFCCTFEEVVSFIENICNGNDLWQEDREYLLKKYYPFADGKTGERLTEYIINEFLKELSEDEKCGCDPQDKVLIIGSYEESRTCVMQLEKDNIDYYFGCDLLPESTDGEEKYRQFSVTDLKKDSFEYIIITSKKLYREINEILTNVYGISQERIILFWKLYKASLPEMACDRTMMNPEYNSLDGIILGISHAQTGIIENNLQGKWCNLAVSSQDLYYNLKTLEHCLEVYPEKIKSIKYAIIDLYDYSYFNFDTSLSDSAVKYILFNGYNLDPHHFDQNKNAKYSYDEYCEYFRTLRFSEITENELKIWKKMFPDALELAGYEDPDRISSYMNLSKRLKTVNDEEIKNYKYDSKTSTVFFRDTIEENVGNLCRIFDTLIGINPDIKIYTVIIPKYIDVELKHKTRMAKHVGYFNNTIEILKKIIISLTLILKFVRIFLQTGLIIWMRHI